MRRLRGSFVALVSVTLLAGCARPAGPSLGDRPAAAAGDTTTAAPMPDAAARWPVLATSGDAKVVVTSTGVVAPVVELLDGAYRVVTPCGNHAEVPTSRANPVEAAHVVVDPGHGGSEVGAVGHNDVTEADLNLAVALELERILEDEEGMEVTLTRYSDYRLPIPIRADIVNALGPSLFLSIHHNGGEAAARDTPGTEVYFQQADPESRRLAGLVWEDLTRTLAAYDVVWQGGSDAGAIYRRDRDGDDFYGVLRRTAGVPAVLVEAAYLSNPSEADLLARLDVQTAEARAIADAVVRWFTTDDPGGGFNEPLFRGYGSSGGGTFANCRDPEL